MNAIQLSLFEDNSETCFLRRDIEELKKKNESLRKGFFFRHHEIEKTVFELKDEILRLKNMIECKKDSV